MVDELLDNIVNVTLNRTTYVQPDLNTLTGSFNVRIVVNNERTTFGLGVSKAGAIWGREVF